MGTDNRWLFSLSRLMRGHQPVFLEFPINMAPRWTAPEPNPHLDAIFAANAGAIARGTDALAEMIPVAQALDAGDLAPLRFDWRNGFLPALDALSVMQAAATARATFFEIGSGNSTIAARAAVTQTGAAARIVSVDPVPRAEVDALCDEVIRDRLETLDLARIAALGPGDVLFVDSSHHAFMGSDVTVIFTEVLPILQPGVLFGIHDIMLPFDYPRGWTKRAYNEQYLLATLLLANPDYFDIRLANAWASQKGLHNAPLAGLWDQLGADVRDRGGSAFWGVKR